MKKLIKGLLVKKQINYYLFLLSKELENNLSYQKYFERDFILKTIKKGLTYVGPGDGEPYF